ncbi:S-adenosyl-L-methionine-dependentmethyltransferases superfamily protein [Striga asiatica]|uniref:RNA methyltransferase n=1 Tax=Striga asiatica TaxID=4170 RepID=A0A5A7PS81_STRAF|nr:S-adenosyl-L-methionine-dependentmethyltransferases superfamily protein [Striga asiatica]
MEVESKSNHKSEHNKIGCNMKRNNNEKKTELAGQSATCNGQQHLKKRNRKEVAIFGNYRNYYGYRVGHDLDEDPRLKMMKREWFEGKDCLDIGCNSGLITIAVAKKFGCRSILGVDIDGARVEDANWTLRKVIRTSTQKGNSKPDRSADAELASSLGNNTSESLTDEKRDDSLETDLLKIVSFQKGNFVQSWRPPENKCFHAIFCLSVSKWIHLNWGDEGLITLFWRVWKLLLPGGIFILEPQPWSSYYNNRLVSETAATNYKNIQFSPEDFQYILLDKIGFRRVENITPREFGNKQGFDRPILAFWK